MPFVLVRIARNLIDDRYELAAPPDVVENSKQFIKKLPMIIAEALSVPGTQGELTHYDIEVKVETFGPLDIHNKDLEIIIWANEYPERRKDLDERQAIIRKKVKAISPALDGFVWVLLQPGSYSEW